MPLVPTANIPLLGSVIWASIHPVTSVIASYRLIRFRKLHLQATL
jgi:hypothetical protein